MYNKTQLNPDQIFEKHVYHRDQFSHYLRWTHVLKIAKINQKILDFGCGSGNLLEVFYRNRFKPQKYVGLDIRKKVIKIANERWNKLCNFAYFYDRDLCDKNLNENEIFNIVCSFEVIEHIGKENVDIFLQNIKKHCDKNTIILLSTPCYDKNVGVANNHIIDGKIGELTYKEMHDAFLKNNFIIKNAWGTFASQKDYKNMMNDWQLKMFNKLNEYYDSNLISNLMAPFFPEYSRNVLWECRI